jgi:hypothetical protein
MQLGKLRLLQELSERRPPAGVRGRCQAPVERAKELTLLLI